MIVEILFFAILGVGLTAVIGVGVRRRMTAGTTDALAAGALHPPALVDGQMRQFDERWADVQLRMLVETLPQDRLPATQWPFSLNTRIQTTSRDHWSFWQACASEHSSDLTLAATALIQHLGIKHLSALVSFGPKTLSVRDTQLETTWEHGDGLAALCMIEVPYAMRQAGAAVAMAMADVLVRHKLSQKLTRWPYFGDDRDEMLVELAAILWGLGAIWVQGIKPEVHMDGQPKRLTLSSLSPNMGFYALSLTALSQGMPKVDLWAWVPGMYLENLSSMYTRAQKVSPLRYPRQRTSCASCQAMLRYPLDRKIRKITCPKCQTVRFIDAEDVIGGLSMSEANPLDGALSSAAEKGGVSPSD